MVTIEKRTNSIYFPNFPLIDEYPIVKPNLVTFVMFNFINPFSENNNKLREMQKNLDYQIVLANIKGIEFVLPAVQNGAQNPSFEVSLSSPEIKTPKEYLSDRGIVRIMKSLEVNSQRE